VIGRVDFWLGVFATGFAVWFAIRLHEAKEQRWNGERSAAQERRHVETLNGIADSKRLSSLLAGRYAEHGERIERIEKRLDALESGPERAQAGRNG